MRHSNFDSETGIFQVFVVILLIYAECSPKHHKKNTHHRYQGRRSTINPYTKTICMQMDNTLRARHKSCFLRADTGPCRADIIQWYFDVKQRQCYQFFWGGCQGNGNRFETKKDCDDYCFLNTTMNVLEIPHFCTLTFEYGSCFGYFNRWAWDRFGKTCKRRLYSGCGGNQNNFETREECQSTCLRPPNNTLDRFNKFTTCVPFNIAELH